MGSAWRHTILTPFSAPLSSLYSGVHINCDGGATCIGHKEYANGVTKVRINPGSSGTAGGCTPGSGSSAKWAFDGAGDAATLSIEVHGELRWRGIGHVWSTEPDRRPFNPDLHLACAKSLPP